MSSAKLIAGGVGVVIILATISYIAWQWKRDWNYSWSYESRVQQTVCVMVKPEYLKNPKECQ